MFPKFIGFISTNLLGKEQDGRQNFETDGENLVSVTFKQINPNLTACLASSQQLEASYWREGQY